MLNGTLALHDLHDVEAFCNAALEQQLKRWHAQLTPTDHEDALAYLLTETWRISTRYNPRRSPSFAAYARPYQPRFLIQFYRNRFVDTRYRRRYTDDQWAAIQHVIFPAPLDPPTDDDHLTGHPAAPDHRQDQLDFTLRAISGDPATDCNPDLARLLHIRDQQSNRLATRRNPNQDARAPQRHPQAA